MGRITELVFMSNNPFWEWQEINSFTVKGIFLVRKSKGKVQII